MPNELSSQTNPTQRDLAFKTFGVMDAGKQDRRSVVTSLLVNGTILLLIFLAGRYAKKVVHREKLTRLDAPIPKEMKKEEPPKPPPVKLPKPPVIVKVEPPKIKLPTIEVPEPPKIPPPVMKAAPVPIMAPAPPKAVTPPPAPKPVNLQIAQAASVANNNPHPSAIRLGAMDNPIKNTSGPAVSPINLGRAGAAGMPAGNTGLGAPSSINIAGSGSPNGSMNGHDNGPRPIKGISTGVPGSNGALTNRTAGAVAIAQTAPPPQLRSAVQASAPAAKAAPKVLFKPKPVYTEEAKTLHLEGTVYVKIHVTASGNVQVVGISSGLGHGLDESAKQAVQSMRFQPAVQDGHPVDWDGVVNINFQLAG